MVVKRNKIIEKVKKLKEEFIKNGYKINQIYLFGSFASGKNKKDSDIDVAVVSDDFSGNRFKDSLKIISFKLKVDNRLEIIPFHSSDFNINDPLVNEIKKDGIKV